VVVKVINDSVRLRMLDELAGVVLRTKADLGIIVSPHHLTASATRYQGSYKSARISVIDGVALADHLQRLGIGVRKSGEIDHQFFVGLDLVGRRVSEFMRREAA